MWFCDTKSVQWFRLSGVSAIPVQQYCSDSKLILILPLALIVMR